MANPSPELTKPSWTWSASFEVGFYTLFLGALLSFLLGTLLEGVSNELNIQVAGSPTGTAIMATSEVSLVIPLLIYMRKFNINRTQLGIYARNWGQALADAAFGILIGLSMIPISIFASILNEILLGPQPGAENITRAYTATSPIEAFLLCSSIALVVAPVEEVVVRGFLQQGFERSFGKAKGLLLASLFFSIMHLNLWSIFPLMLLGVIVGLCFQLKHWRIMAPIACHACYMVGLVFSLSF
nr:CPBP family intramembrane metalloprotease [Candidatus Njordarchaeota archaeon]